VYLDTPPESLWSAVPAPQVHPASDRPAHTCPRQPSLRTSPAGRTPTGRHTAIANAILPREAERARRAVAEQPEGTAALLRGFLTW